MSEPLEHTPDETTTPPQPAPRAQEPQGRMAALSNPHDPRRKSVLLATILSGMPGLGQVYVGYYQRGFIHALVVGTLISLITEDVMGAITPLASLFLAFFWLYNAIDAGRKAALYNFALSGGGEIELPDDFKAPSMSGSFAGGVALIAVGAILLGNTAFDMPLEWVERWWPAAFIAAGVYLAWKAKQDAPPAADDPYETD